MILIDANLCLYAYDTESPDHLRAKRWLDEALSGDESVGFGLITLLAFLRIATNPQVFRRPLRTTEGLDIVHSWLEQPPVRVAQPTADHWQVLGRVAGAGKAKAALMMGAHLAALAIEHGATLYTSDRDFARFPGLRLRDPLAG